ncbi:GGDEF domain-containing protein [Sulfurimonas sp. NW15]|uniref:sensor domain-containing diguanylate cyclase n=1 Tax=Sulfurimonas sp. NW15 TaxID=2922729 RepID=UPI003DA9BCE0
MKSYNIIYKDEKTFQKFVKKYKLKEEKALLVQVLSGITEEEFCLSLAQFIKKELPYANIIGTTTAGGIANAVMYDKEVVLSLSLFKKSTVASKLYSFEDDFNVAMMQKALVRENTKAMIIFSDGFKSNAEALIENIHRTMPDIVIAGGRAGDELFQKTFVFDEKNYSDNGCVIATLSGEELHAKSDYILAWTPIGKEMIVTKAQETVLYELDGIPVLDIYKRYLGKHILEKIPEACAPFPLLLKKGDITVARDPIAVTQEGFLQYAGRFEVGDVVRFSFADIEDLTDHLDELYGALSRHCAETIFIYSCVARKALLGEKLEDELGVLEAIAPTGGFFTFGEFFQSSEMAELLNVTTTALFLSESDYTECEKKSFAPKHTFDSIKKSLTHLVKMTSQELETLTIHDPLTALYNRQEYIRIVTKKIKSAKRYGEVFGMMMIDIDFFKLVNDNYGHDVGDHVLKKIAQILLKNVREDDFVARWGGEEFIIIVKNAKVEALEKVAQKIQKKMLQESFAPVPKVTLSFGLTLYCEGDDEDALFKRVDNALYRAKENGRNQYIIG